MWRTFKELVPLVIKAWLGWTVGALGGAIGLMLDAGLKIAVPWWGWAAIIVAGLLAALIQSFHRIRLERDSYRPDPQSMGKWPIRDGVQYIIDDSLWGVGQANDPIAFDNVLPSLREAALNGFVVVWGRRSQIVFTDHEPLIPISKDYWMDFTFDELRCLPADFTDESVATKTRRDHGQDQADDIIYEDISLVRLQVRSYWPRALVWQKFSLNLGGLLKPRRPV